MNPPPNSAQGEPATPESPPEGTTQVVKHGGTTSLADSQERLARREIRIKKRELKLRGAVTEIQLGAVEDMKLKELAFLPDEELAKRGLTDAQKAKVRGWEQPKRHAPFALESSSTIATSMIRGEREKSAVGINVEKLIIKLPEQGAAQLPEAIVVDAEVVSK